MRLYKERHQATPEQAVAEFVMLELSDFRIYRPTRETGKQTGWRKTSRDFEMECLDRLHAKTGVSSLLFDGILSIANIRHYVEGVPFTTLTVEGYDDPAIDTIRNHLCIQSTLGQKEEVWYILKSASSEYCRFYEPFLWVADFCKHFIDYLSQDDSVTLNHFRSDFKRWISLRYPGSLAIQEWLSQYGRTDFRHALIANIEYLHKEYDDVVSSNRWLQPLWKEVAVDPHDLKTVKKHAPVEVMTIVTPFVYSCFKNMYFAKWLKPVDFDGNVARKRQRRLTNMGFARDISRTWNHLLPSVITRTDSQRRLKVRIGDVVGVPRDAETHWKDEADIWYGYVQDIRKSRTDVELLDILWLYRPSDTTLAQMTYPYKNELFFSDNCNCQDGDVTMEEVVCKLDIELFPKDLDQDGSFFIRQKYCKDDQSFVTLKHDDLQCVCRSAKVQDFERVRSMYSPGESVLILSTRGDLQDHEILEPVVIARYNAMEGRVMVRRLPRRKRDFGHSAQPNELVWSEDMYLIPPKRVVRRCHIRFYTPAECDAGAIPSPYDRDGRADCFYITSRIISGNHIQTEGLYRPFPTGLVRRLVQGFDPIAKPSFPKLAGLDLFCGGGNYGRGLEGGGVVKMKYAVDLNVQAVHTYRSNLEDTNGTQVFHGSVNDCLAHALRGNTTPGIACVGDIDFIASGSPCQGLSNLQPNKQHDDSLRNTSLVASVAGFIDAYRPQYAILENVPPMANTIQATGENVFSQLLCALVGMGYQVNQYLLDAWSFGDSQSRGRLFVVVSAPGLEPLAHPNLTHAHPTNVPARSLGRAINGEKFGERKFVPTAFNSIPASESVKDLPWVDESRVQTCIPFPDHRIARIERPLIRGQILMVPVAPLGSTFAQAIIKGLVSQPQLEEASRHTALRHAKNSRSWSRIHPDKVFPTITTRIVPADALCGTVLHWEQHRVISVMEARRAQGFPDSEVIVGNPYTQWHIIGNSVARGTALALGMSLRAAWLTNGRTKPASSTKNAPTTLPSLPAKSSSSLSNHSTAPCAFGQTKLTERAVMVAVEIPSPTESSLKRHAQSAQRLLKAQRRQARIMA